MTRYKYRKLATTVAVLGWLAVVIQACGSPATTRAIHPVKLTVHITQAGVILVNGKPDTLEHFKELLVGVKEEGGAVAYSRDNPKGPPPPHAMDVLHAITDAEVPVQIAIPRSGG